VAKVKVFIDNMTQSKFKKVLAELCEQDDLLAFINLLCNFN